MSVEQRRVLHVLAPAPYGGLERVVEMLTRGQRDAGHDSRVLAVVNPSEAGAHPFVALLERGGLPVQTLAVPARAYRSEQRLTAAFLRDFSPHIVHTHGHRSDVITAQVARRQGRKTVSTVHGFTGGGVRIRVYEWLQVRALRRMDAVVAVSGPLVRRLTGSGVSQGLLHRIPNAWSPSDSALSRDRARQVLGLRAEARVVGWVGRLGQEKGPDVLLRALPFFSGPDVQIVLLGGGPMRASLETLVSALGMASRVHLLGAVPEAGRYLRAFDCFVMSSRTEGTPIALFEAMAAEIPVVATRVGGIPDVVSEEHALLVPPEDPPALALAVNEVLRHPGVAAARSGAAALRLRTAFAVPPWVAAYDAVYERVLGRNQA